MHNDPELRRLVTIAALRRDRFVAIEAPPMELEQTDPAEWLAQSREWENRIDAAREPTLAALGELLNYLQQQLGISSDTYQVK